MFKRCLSLLFKIVLLASAASIVASCMRTPVTAQQAPQDRQVMVREIQSMLNGMGYDAGPEDGIPGARTVNALAAFQSDRNLSPTGGVNAEAFAQVANAAGGATRTAAASTTPGGDASRNRQAAEDARRRELSRNDSLVSFRADCPGLFIPEVSEKRHQGVIPVYAMRVLNNSDKRYSVRYDIQYTERGQNYFGRTGGTFTVERNFTSRPGGYTEFLIMEKNKGSGTTVTSIDSITVFDCRTT